MPRILVIGGASLDVLHLPGGPVFTPGGAGMYTAMAAQRSGAEVTLFAPRPSPLPAPLEPVAGRLHAWRGPEILPGELPRFEISYEGDAATYLHEDLGAERAVSPADLPADLSAWDIVHVIPLGSEVRQLEFVRTCRARAARMVSAGTYLLSVTTAPGIVRQVLREADVFFMNEAEAAALFGSLDGALTGAGQVLFVTRGAAGARVILGRHRSDIPAPAAVVRDPTGAGDTFCGATLAGLGRAEHPVMAARAAAPLASAMVEQVGPTALFAHGPLSLNAAEDVAAVDEGRVHAVAAILSRQRDAAPSSFLGPGLPAQGEPGALAFFLAVTLQQFGFWYERSGRYHEPMIAPLGGISRKGSDYLFAAYLRAQAFEPGFCAPARQAALTQDELRTVFRADDGSDPLPALELHLEQAHRYGEDMLALGLTPASLLEQASSSRLPVRALLSLLDGVGGYKEDPLRKKSCLLALILAQRPERFLVPGAGEAVPPAIDYHLMRSCLRTGLVEVRDPELRRALVERRVIDAAQEWTVRQAAWQAIQQVTERSGRSAGTVDWFFFSARRRCPEMTPPDCARCALDPACAHRQELFQPVHRTTFY
jgi:sugar/nucleoside kinase (ribokinase family)